MSGAHLPFGLKGEKLKPGAMKTISDTKLATFVVGQQKKSRFQKQKEVRNLLGGARATTSRTPTAPTSRVPTPLPN